MATPTGPCDYPDEAPPRSFSAYKDPTCETTTCPEGSPLAPGEYDDYSMRLFGLGDASPSDVLLRIDRAMLDGIAGAIAWRDDDGDEVSGTFTLAVCVD